MSMTDEARSAAQRVRHNPILERVTRAGFIGYGIVHLLVAWLALQIAFGKPAPEGDQSSAMRALADQPFGRFLVICVCVGLAAMALWQLLEAAVGHQQEQGRRRTLERLASVGRTLVYGYFCFTGIKVLKGSGSSNADSQQAATAKLMAEPGGQILVGLIGLGLTALGIGLIWYGVTRQFERHLLTGPMSGPVRTGMLRLGTGGYVAKGVAYGIAGVLVVVAAATFDPDKSRGLDAALRTLAEQPYGTVLLVVVALGVFAFGIFAILQARYRKV